MNIDGKCTICKQQLTGIKTADQGQLYYIEHENVSDCLKALGNRIEALEEEVREQACLSRLGL